MRTCLERLRAALNHLDPSASEPCLEYVEQCGKLRADHVDALGEAFATGASLPKRPPTPPKLVESVLAIDPDYRAEIYGLSSRVLQGWQGDDEEQEEAGWKADPEHGPRETPDYHLDHSCKDALEDLLDLLRQSTLVFLEDCELREFLRGLKNTGREKIHQFLTQNFQLYRQFRSMQQYLACDVHNLRRAGELESESHIYREILPDFVTFHEQCSPDPKDWFVELLPQIDGWSLALGDHLRTLPDDAREPWREILELAAKGTERKPNKAFGNHAESVLGAQPPGTFETIFNQVEGAYGEPAAHGVEGKKGFGEIIDLPHKENLARLITLVHLVPLAPSQRAHLCLERMIDKSFAKIRDYGPRCEKVGQAGIDALVATEDPEKKDRLIRILKAHGQNSHVEKRIAKGLDAIDEG